MAVGPSGHACVYLSIPPFPPTQNMVAEIHLASPSTFLFFFFCPSPCPSRWRQAAGAVTRFKEREGPEWPLSDSGSGARHAGWVPLQPKTGEKNISTRLSSGFYFGSTVHAAISRRMGKAQSCLVCLLARCATNQKGIDVSGWGRK